MTSREEWLADRRRFVRLVTERDPQGDLPIAIRLDLTPEQVAVMAPGISDYDEMRDVCLAWIKNFLAPSIDRMERHLAFEHRRSRRG